MQILLGALPLLAGGRKSLGAKFCSKCLCAAAEQGGKRADGPALSAAASDGLSGLVCAAEWLQDGRWRSGVWPLVWWPQHKSRGFGIVHEDLRHIYFWIVSACHCQCLKWWKRISMTVECAGRERQDLSRYRIGPLAPGRGESWPSWGR